MFISFPSVFGRASRVHVRPLHRLCVCTIRVLGRWFACFISCVEVYVVVRIARTRLRPCIWSIGNAHAVAAMYSIGSGSMSSVRAVLTKETLSTPTVIFIRFFNRVKLDA